MRAVHDKALAAMTAPLPARRRTTYAEEKLKWVPRKRHHSRWPIEPKKQDRMVAHLQPYIEFKVPSTSAPPIETPSKLDAKQMARRCTRRLSRSPSKQLAAVRLSPVKKSALFMSPVKKSLGCLSPTKVVDSPHRTFRVDATPTKVNLNSIKITPPRKFPLKPSTPTQQREDKAVTSSAKPSVATPATTQPSPSTPLLPLLFDSPVVDSQPEPIYETHRRTSLHAAKRLDRISSGAARLLALKSRKSPNRRHSFTTLSNVQAATPKPTKERRNSFSSFRADHNEVDTLTTDNLRSANATPKNAQRVVEIDMKTDLDIFGKPSAAPKDGAATQGPVQTRAETTPAPAITPSAGVDSPLSSLAALFAAGRNPPDTPDVPSRSATPSDNSSPASTETPSRSSCLPAIPKAAANAQSPAAEAAEVIGATITSPDVDATSSGLSTSDSPKPVPKETTPTKDLNDNDELLAHSPSAIQTCFDATSPSPMASDKVGDASSETLITAASKDATSSPTSSPPPASSPEQATTEHSSPRKPSQLTAELDAESSPKFTPINGHTSSPTNITSGSSQEKDLPEFEEPTHEQQVDEDTVMKDAPIEELSAASNDNADQLRVTATEPLKPQDGSTESDMDMLRDFITRVTAEKTAALAANAAAKSERRGHIFGATPSKVESDTSPSRTPLGEKSPNSPTTGNKKRKLDEFNNDVASKEAAPSEPQPTGRRLKRRRSLDAVPTSIDGESPDQNNSSDQASAGLRRSTRARTTRVDLTRSAPSANIALSQIPRARVSRSGASPTTPAKPSRPTPQDRKKELELEALTRVNTRNNKGAAIPPPLMLLMLNADLEVRKKVGIDDVMEPKKGSEAQVPAKQTDKPKKSVRFAENLVSYREPSPTVITGAERQAAASLETVIPDGDEIAEAEPTVGAAVAKTQPVLAKKKVVAGKRKASPASTAAATAPSAGPAGPAVAPASSAAAKRSTRSSRLPPPKPVAKSVVPGEAPAAAAATAAAGSAGKKRSASTSSPAPDRAAASSARSPAAKPGAKPTAVVRGARTAPAGAPRASAKSAAAGSAPTGRTTRSTSAGLAAKRAAAAAAASGEEMEGVGKPAPKRKGTAAAGKG